MEAKTDGRHSLETRLDELDRHMDQLEETIDRMSVDARASLHSRLSTLRTRSAEVRARLRDKQDADDKAGDIALRELGHTLNGMYAELEDWPRPKA